MGSVSERRARERIQAEGERGKRGRGKIDSVVDKGSWKREIRWKGKGQAMENQLESNSTVGERARETEIRENC